MKHLSILGSTGSIGVSTLEIVAAHPERFRIAALNCHHEPVNRLVVDAHNDAQFSVLGLRRVAFDAPEATS